MSARELVIGLCISAALVSATQGGEGPPKRLSIGDPAPGFQGVDLDGKTEKSLATFRDSRVLVVCFTCISSPVSRGYERRFIDFAERYEEKGVAFVAINVNQDENLRMIRSRDKEIRSPKDKRGFTFPYLYDSSQESAKRYTATTTPELFVFDKGRRLVYHGGFDDSLTKPRRRYVRDAVEAALAGRLPPRTRTASYGTPIKYKR